MACDVTIKTSELKIYVGYLPLGNADILSGGGDGVVRKYVTQVYQAFLTLVSLFKNASAKTFAKGMRARVLYLDVIFRENFV